HAREVDVDRLQHREAEIDRREVRAREQHAAPGRESALEVLAAVDCDTLRNLVVRQVPTRGRLEERDTHGLEAADDEIFTLAGGELGKADFEVAAYDAPLAGPQAHEQPSEPAPGRELPRERPAADDGQDRKHEPGGPVAQRPEARE